MYIYTSGTTGLPKAAVITNQRYVGLCERDVGGLIPTGSNMYVFYKLDIFLSSAATDKKSNSGLDMSYIDFFRTPKKDQFLGLCG